MSLSYTIYKISSIFCDVYKNEQKYDINFKPVLQCTVLYLIENLHCIMLHINISFGVLMNIHYG